MSFASSLRITIPAIVKCGMALCLLTYPIFSQTTDQEKTVIDMKGLIRSLEIARTDRTPITRIINLIKQHGVDFQLTFESEKQIRAAGSYFSEKRLNDLVS